MSDFNPGPGWREVDRDDWYNASQETLALEKGKHDPAAKYWVHEQPVPPLPTEPYTVIRVTWDPGHEGDWPSVLALGVDREWAWSTVGGTGFIDVHDLPKWITGFEVLAAPRHIFDVDCIGRLEQVKRDTARTVLDRLPTVWAHNGDVYDTRAVLAREFEVES